MRKMNSIWRFLTLLFGEILIIIFCLLIVLMSGGSFLLSYFVQTVPFLGIVGGTLLILLVSGQLKDFGKAFVLAVKPCIEHSEGKRASMAVLCAIISALMMSIAVTMIGIIAAQDGFIMETMEPFVVATVYAYCAAIPSCGIVLIILLVPVYFRIKRQIIE